MPVPTLRFLPTLVNSERASLHIVLDALDTMLPTRTLFLNLQIFQKAGIVAAGLPQRDPVALSKGIAIVRKVLQDNKGQNHKGWKTHEIYSLALKEQAPEGFKSAVVTTPWQVAPPHPEHPIRSKKFLKDILGHMEGYRDIKVVRTMRGGSAAFVWKLVNKDLLPKPSSPRPKTPSVGIPLGLHEDITHLNKRRQRARKEKIVRGILKIKAARRATTEALEAKASEQAPSTQTALPS